MALEHLKDAARVIGLKQVRKAVQGGRAAAVFLADDADARISCGICKTCTYPDAPCRFPDRARRSMEACGIDVGAAAAALTQESR